MAFRARWETEARSPVAHLVCAHIMQPAARAPPNLSVLINADRITCILVVLCCVYPHPPTFRQDRRLGGMAMFHVCPLVANLVL